MHYAAHAAIFEHLCRLNTCCGAYWALGWSVGFSVHFSSLFHGLGCGKVVAMPKRTRSSRADEGDSGTPKKARVSSGEESKGKTDWAAIKWNDLGATKDGRPWNKKFSTWNVNGVRAWLKNGGLEYVKQESPDIFTVQETKCSEDDLPVDQLNVEGYHSYWHSAEKKGYSGVGLYSKEEPIKVTKGIGMDKYDCEGRLITAEYPDFFFLTSYVPNAGEGLKRLSYKQEWDVDLRNYMKKLDQTKPVILCGDLNVAHQEIDLKNPKTNHKTAGFTPEEREDFTLLLKEGFVDVFRHLYPDKLHAYTYWSYRFNARAKDTGWRLDYFVVSESLLKDVCDCIIRKSVLGSDHCPLVLSLATPSSSIADSAEPAADTSAPTDPCEGSPETNGDVTADPPTSIEQSSDSPALISDSETPAVISNSETPAVISDSETPALISDSETPALISDSGTPALISDSGTPAMISDSGTPAVISDSGTPAVISDSGTPAVISDSGKETPDDPTVVNTTSEQ